jgi:membrane-associated protease RseP (regulator of RpoE activity)
MKNHVVSSVFLLSAFISIGQSIEFKADKDNEFATGSKITSINLTPGKTHDLQVLGQIWGFLKYYHPSVAAGEYNWDYELFRILPKVISVENQIERNALLNDWIKRIGKLGPGRQFPKFDSAKLVPDLSWMNPAVLGDELTASLKSIKNADRTNSHYYVELASRVGNPQFKNERSYLSIVYKDPGFRLLCLYRYWNMINYYFPYKGLIEENWNDVLKEFIPRFVDAEDELQYKLAVLTLITRIHDTHANIWGRDHNVENLKGLKYAPLEVKFVEGKAIVTDYLDKVLGEESGLKVGDIILSVNGTTVQEFVATRLDITPASNYPTKLRNISMDLLRSNDDTLNIAFMSGAQRKSSLIKTFSTNEINVYSKFQRKDTCFRMLQPNISYIYPATIKNEFLPTIMKHVANTKGLIIDFRCYPSDFIVFTLGEYLLPSPKSFVKFSIGSVITPGLFTFGATLKVGKNNPDYYKGKIVIIINEFTQSSAEYQTMGLRTAPRATVIGSTTAAADGNMSQIVLPGGIQTAISGIGVYYPDGTETQRIGIVPDIEVKPTIKGIRVGKDELLEKAISIINNN